MKITRRQLRRIIRETIETHPRLADRVKKEKRKDGGGDFVWFAKPIETAHNWTLGYAGDVIARLQSERG